MSKWYQLSGSENDVALCTKVALARNVSGYPFTVKLSLNKRQEIDERLKAVLDEELPEKFHYSKMSDFTQDQAISLAERNLVSPEFVSSAGGRSFYFTDDESLSIMLFEEDHIKIQGLLPGLELEKAYELSDTLDSILDKHLSFSFDEELGFLTQCPTNIGTAMRASVLLHLPGLSKSGQISKLALTVSKLGLVLTGAYGEGSNPRGDLYTLSNQVTLGITEKSAIDNLSSISLSIIEQERTTREKLLNNISYQDCFWRSLGSLSNARIMGFDELIENISNIKIGLKDSKTNIPVQKINEMIFTMQPASINAGRGLSLDRQERDTIRAKCVREVFNHMEE